MNHKKIIITGIFLSILLIPLVRIQAGALQDARKGLKDVESIVGFTNNEGNNDIAVIVGKIIKVVLGTVGVVYMALTIYGGWLYMTAAGNQERVEQAKNLLRDSIIGLIIIITAYAITTFVVFSITGATGA